MRVVEISYHAAIREKGTGCRPAIEVDGGRPIRVLISGRECKALSSFSAFLTLSLTPLTFIELLLLRVLSAAGRFLTPSKDLLGYSAERSLTGNNRISHSCLYNKCT